MPVGWSPTWSFHPAGLPAPAPPPPPAPSPPPPPPPAPPPTGGGEVVISFIFFFFDGLVPRVESDEYVEVTNQGADAQAMSGWRINAGDPGQDFFFPSGFTLSGSVLQGLYQRVAS